MEKVAFYRQVIQKVLARQALSLHAADDPNAVEDQLLFDTERDHYQLFAVGWERGKRVYFPVFHLDIKNGKIWLQENAADDFDIVAELEAEGVSKQDIVIGFQPPQVRSHTGYAVA